MSCIKELLDKIIEDGVITESEHDMFMESVYADGEIDDEESEQISRMFNLIKEGKVKVINEEREMAEAARREDIENMIKNKK